MTAQDWCRSDNAVLQMQDVWNSKLDTIMVRVKQYPLFFRIFAIF